MLKLYYDYDYKDTDDLIIQIKSDLFLLEEMEHVIVEPTEIDNRFYFILYDRKFQIEIFELEEEIVVELSQI